MLATSFFQTPQCEQFFKTHLFCNMCHTPFSNCATFKVSQNPLVLQFLPPPLLFKLHNVKHSSIASCLAMLAAPLFSKLHLVKISSNPLVLQCLQQHFFKPHQMNSFQNLLVLYTCCNLFTTPFFQTPPCAKSQAFWQHQNVCYHQGWYIFSLLACRDANSLQHFVKPHQMNSFSNLFLLLCLLQSYFNPPPPPPHVKSSSIASCLPHPFFKLHHVLSPRVSDNIRMYNY